MNGHFLLPHNGLARIVTNRDGITRLNYQLLLGPNGEKTQVVSLGEQGEVRAAAVSGHAVVMVTESEEVYRLNQTLMVHVEVSETWELIDRLSCTILYRVSFRNCA